jgi:hypothetical protein
MSVKGLPPEAAMLFGGGALGQEVSLIDVAGKHRGKDTQLTVKGAFLTFFGFDPGKSLEVIEAGGKTYIHGPAPMLGATENKWYVLDQSMSGQSFTKDLQASVDQSFDYKSLTSADLSFIKTMGKQALHGRQCDVYGATDKNAIVKALESASTTSVPASDLDQIDRAEVKFWVCDDGYFHQAWVSIEGATADRPNDKIGFRMRLSLFDYNGSFTIAAPPNPAKLDPPNFGGTVFETLPSTPSAPVSGPTATVFNGGNIRQAPNVKGQVLGQLHAGQTIALFEKTVDGRWYLVSAPEATGWVHASLLRIAPERKPGFRQWRGECRRADQRVPPRYGDARRQPARCSEHQGRSAWPGSCRRYNSTAGANQEWHLVLCDLPLRRAWLGTCLAAQDRSEGGSEGAGSLAITRAPLAVELIPQPGVFLFVATSISLAGMV